MKTTITTITTIGRSAAFESSAPRLAVNFIERDGFAPFGMSRAACSMAVFGIELNLKDFKMYNRFSLRQILSKWRPSFLRWISIILQEPCLVRRESPESFLERHEFENVEIRQSLLSPHRW